MENGILPLNKDKFSKLIQIYTKDKTASQDFLLNGLLI